MTDVATTEVTPSSDGRVPLVELRNISVAFGGVHAVNDVTVDLYAGEVVGLVGGNGAGKSTLVHTLSGAHPADSGEIRIDGQLVRSTTPATPAARHRGHLPTPRARGQHRRGRQLVPRSGAAHPHRCPRRLGDGVGDREGDAPVQPAVQEPEDPGAVALRRPAPVGGHRPRRALQRPHPDHGRADGGARSGRDGAGTRAGHAAEGRRHRHPPHQSRHPRRVRSCPTASASCCRAGSSTRSTRGT